MDTDSITITPETARIALWVFGVISGPPPALFPWRLMELIATATTDAEHGDRSNLDKLAAAYPAEAAAVRMANTDPAGSATLRRIAAGA